LAILSGALLAGVHATAAWPYDDGAPIVQLPDGSKRASSAKPLPWRGPRRAPARR